MKKFELSLQEVTQIENFNLKQQLIDIRFSQLDKELKDLRENNILFWKEMSLKYKEDFINKKINFSGNTLEILEDAV